MMDVVVSGPVDALIELVIVEADGSESRTALWDNTQRSTLAAQMISFGGPAYVDEPSDVVVGSIEIDDLIVIHADGKPMSASDAGDRMVAFLRQVLLQAVRPAG